MNYDINLSVSKVISYRFMYAISDLLGIVCNPIYRSEVHTFVDLSMAAHWHSQRFYRAIKSRSPCFLGALSTTIDINLLAHSSPNYNIQVNAHHGPTESRFFARARATNGLGTFTRLLWKVLRGFKNNSRGALGDNGH